MRTTSWLRPATRRDSRLLKATVILSAIAISVGMMLAHQAGRIYPWFAVPLFVAVLTVAIPLLFRTNILVPVYLALIVTIGVVFRTFIYTFPTGMLGADGDSLAVTIAGIASGETPAIIAGQFYPTAPLFFLYSAGGMTIGSTSSRWALTIYPLLIGVIFPMGVFVTARRLNVGVPGSLAAATFVAVAPSPVKRGFAPVPEALAVAMFAVCLFLLVRSLSRPRYRTVAVLLVLLLGMTLTHKLVIFVVFLVVFGTLLLKTLDRPILSVDVRDFHVLGLVLLAGALLYLQWTVITNFLRAVLLQISPILQLLFELTPLTAPSIPTGGTGDAVASNAASTVSDERVLDSGVRAGIELAIQPLPLRVVYNVGYGIAAGTVAGIVWLWLFLTRRDHPLVQFVLSGAAVTVSVTAVFLLFSSKHGPQRMLIYADLFFGLLFGFLVATVTVSDVDRSWRSATVTGLAIAAFILILFAQVLTPGFYPDAPDKTRKYLTDAEISGKLFGAAHASDTVSASPYYSGETAPPLTPANEQRQASVFRNMREELSTATIPVATNPYVAYRPGVDVHRMGGSYRLTWDPSRLLDRHYDRVYSNDEVRIYHYPHQ